jgi:alkylation response protein AidB-like acyl-CoA dehydrogenase
MSVTTMLQPALSLKQKAHALHDLLAAQGASNEAAGELSETTLAALRDNGFFSMFVPASLGGAEVTPADALEIIETLCHADASTGWVVMASQLATGAAGAFLPNSAVAKLFKGPCDHPVIAGQGAANGRARVVPAGYRLSGKWSYGSGLKHATHIHTGAWVFENDLQRLVSGTSNPERRIFIVPIEEAQLGDNWDVIGLRATGSIDYVLDDVFVPDERTHDPAETFSTRGGSFYRIGQLGMGTIGHTAFALGVARHALDELRTIATSKQVRPGITLSDGESFQENYATADGKLRAARAFVFDAWRDVEAETAKGHCMTQRQITNIRLALMNVTQVGVEVCNFALRSSGGTGLRAGALQRCVRDMTAGAQHILVSAAILRDCGVELLGRTDGRLWATMGLTKP